MRNVKCRNCHNYRNEWCEPTIDSPHPDIERDCAHFRIKTNADHIRSMTDEELADFISNLSYTDAWKCGEHYVDCNNECEKCVAEWLKQPYKEDT